MSEYTEPESMRGGRERAIDQIGRIGVLSSYAQDERVVRAIADTYLGLRSGPQAAQVPGGEMVEAAERVYILPSLEDFLTSPFPPNSMTLARQRMYDRWNLTAGIEAQLPDACDMLAAAGYEPGLVDRLSGDAKVQIDIVAGITDTSGLIALRRNRRMVRGVRSQAGPKDPGAVLEIDKTSWFALDINHAPEVLAREVRLIVIDGMLRGLSLDRVRLEYELKRELDLMADGRAEPDGLLSNPSRLHQFVETTKHPDERLPHEVREAIIGRNDQLKGERHELNQVIELMQRYNIPPAVLLGRQLHAHYPARLWSPLSREVLEDYIAAATPGFPYENPKLLAAYPNLLSPAATAYYITRYSRHEAEQRAKAHEGVRRSVARAALTSHGAFISGKG